PGDAEGQVDPRLDRLARLADLARICHPAGVDYRAGHTQGGAELVSQALEAGDVVLILDSPADRQKELCLGDVHVPDGDFLKRDVLRPCRAFEVHLDRSRGGPTRARSRGLEDPGSHGHERAFLTGEFELGVELVAVGTALRTRPV